MADPKMVAQGIERRKAILSFVRGHISEHGYAPSTREIAEAVGVASQVVVHTHLVRLAEQGYLTVTPRVARGIVLTAKGRRAT